MARRLRSRSSRKRDSGWNARSPRPPCRPAVQAGRCQSASSRSLRRPGTGKARSPGLRSLAPTCESPIATCRRRARAGSSDPSRCPSTPCSRRQTTPWSTSVRRRWFGRRPGRVVVRRRGPMHTPARPSGPSGRSRAEGCDRSARAPSAPTSCRHPGTCRCPGRPRCGCGSCLRPSPPKPYWHRRRRRRANRSTARAGCRKSAPAHAAVDGLVDAP